MGRETERTMKAREKDWLDAQIFDDEYHLRQFKKPYRSTVKFCDFLEKHGVFANCRSVIDIGTGAGANVYYMAKRFPDIYFVGLDINEKLVALGREKIAGLKNAKLICGNLYHLSPKLKNKFDCVVSYQTLSWLPEYKKPIESMMGLNPKYIALTSLFFDGPVEYRIVIKDWSIPTAGRPFRKNFYNIYSIEKVREVFRKNNYTQFISQPFEIDIDLEKPAEGKIGTYTEKLENGKRIQISGALLLPWYFILASKY